MTGGEKIRAAARRILGRMESFKAGTGLVGPEGSADLLGVYDAPGGGPGPVWVTSAGLQLQKGAALEAHSTTERCARSTRPTRRMWRIRRAGGFG